MSRGMNTILVTAGQPLALPFREAAARCRRCSSEKNAAWAGRRDVTTMPASLQICRGCGHLRHLGGPACEHKRHPRSV
jgi:hypothetical protein